ncbi:MAG: hypothetical protein MUO78_02750, partial [candidate division Zixibacteria bacterium]|nr:hypothetical protein [candidate division Zixibacteria bacterium]
PEMYGLPELEFNYFVERKVELCVTPETPLEILNKYPISCLGTIAYDRFQKSQFFKLRPPGTTLNLTEKESNTLWMGTKSILYPGVSDANLTPRQIADVNQIFYHTTASGSLNNSAFLTMDTNFHNHAEELNTELGIRVLYPKIAWEEFQPKFGLYIPKAEELKLLRDEVLLNLEKLRIEANK